MELYELNLNQYIEVKLLRLNKPKFNSTLLPLSGTYNSIENLKQLEEIPFDSKDPVFENKFREFGINDYTSVGIDNMMQLSSSFGKVLFCENLEALLIINNTSDKEIKIRDFKVKISNEILDGYDSMFRRIEYNLINSQNVISIPGNQFYNQKIKLNADVMCKYAVEIEIQYTSPYFNEEFIKHSSNKIVKTISMYYSIEGNSTVIRKYYKKFVFATNLPFKIKDKYVNDNMTQSYVEINLINQSQYNLHITDMILMPDSDKSNVGNVNFISLLHEKQMKNFNIEPEEEVNAVFLLNNYKSSISHVIGLYLNFFNFFILYFVLEFLCF